MFKLLLFTVVVVPVAVGMQSAARLGRRRGLAGTVVFVLAYDIFFIALLYYLRMHWVG